MKENNVLINSIKINYQKDKQQKIDPYHLFKSTLKKTIIFAQCLNIFSLHKLFLLNSVFCEKKSKEYPTEGDFFILIIYTHSIVKFIRTTILPSSTLIIVLYRKCCIFSMANCLFKNGETSLEKVQSPDSKLILAWKQSYTIYYMLCSSIREKGYILSYSTDNWDITGYQIFRSDPAQNP